MSYTLQLFLVSSLPLILALLLLKSLYFSSKSYKNLPPSPPKLPLIGNLHQLGSSPHRALHALAQTYGPLMLLRLGTVPVLVASSVDAARDIMKTHDLIFSNRPKLNIPNILCYGSKDIAFAQYGEYWRQVKSIAVLHLLTNKRVLSYRHVREDEMALMIKKIRETHESEVNLSEFLISFTNNLVCRVALGRTYEGRKFKSLLERFLELLGCFSVGSYVPSLAWVDRLSGLERRAHEVAKEFDEFFESVIDEHVSKKFAGVEGQDLVDILLEVQRDNSTGFHIEKDVIKAIILDVFAAGTDTTFTNLEWAVSELLRHPQAMKKLQQEAWEIGQGRPMITEDDLEKMAYLKAVLKETLRLHTPIPLLVPRESTQDVKLLGYDIPSDTQVIINAWAIARDPSTWKEPNEFRPERFLNSPIDYKGLHFEFIPFGGGRRGCPAIQFAMVINELVLANLVYKFHFKLASEGDLDMSESIGLTVHKKRPILVSATPCS
ncbi:cytochrome P450 [Artemisia annua]|uniref:Cytochrome P450 n=1 Tax=Artemisia annua TaxID=35608 RepID=A0A2U1PEB2_ARTAN|nr:cytochrome P450 [Artemisia annua]